MCKCIDFFPNSSKIFDFNEIINKFEVNGVRPVNDFPLLSNLRSITAPPCKGKNF